MEEQYTNAINSAMHHFDYKTAQSLSQLLVDHVIITDSPCSITIPAYIQLARVYIAQGEHRLALLVLENVEIAEEVLYLKALCYVQLREYGLADPLLMILLPALHNLLKTVHGDEKNDQIDTSFQHINPVKFPHSSSSPLTQLPSQLPSQTFPNLMYNTRSIVGLFRPLLAHSYRLKGTIQRRQGQILGACESFYASLCYDSTIWTCFKASCELRSKFISQKNIKNIFFNGIDHVPEIFLGEFCDGGVQKKNDTFVYNFFDQFGNFDFELFKNSMPAPEDDIVCIPSDSISCTELYPQDGENNAGDFDINLYSKNGQFNNKNNNKNIIHIIQKKNIKNVPNLDPKNVNNDNSANQTQPGMKPFNPEQLASFHHPEGSKSFITSKSNQNNHSNEDNLFQTKTNFDSAKTPQKNQHTPTTTTTTTTTISPHRYSLTNLSSHSSSKLPPDIHQPSLLGPQPPSQSNLHLRKMLKNDQNGHKNDDKYTPQKRAKRQAIEMESISEPYDLPNNMFNDTQYTQNSFSLNSPPVPFQQQTAKNFQNKSSNSLAFTITPTKSLIGSEGQSIYEDSDTDIDDGINNNEEGSISFASPLKNEHKNSSASFSTHKLSPKLSTPGRDGNVLPSTSAHLYAIRQSPAMSQGKQRLVDEVDMIFSPPQKNLFEKKLERQNLVNNNNNNNTNNNTNNNIFKNSFDDIDDENNTAISNIFNLDATTLSSLNHPDEAHNTQPNKPKTQRNSHNDFDKNSSQNFPQIKPNELRTQTFVPTFSANSFHNYDESTPRRTPTLINRTQNRLKSANLLKNDTSPYSITIENENDPNFDFGSDDFEAENNNENEDNIGQDLYHPTDGEYLDSTINTTQQNSVQSRVIRPAAPQKMNKGGKNKQDGCYDQKIQNNAQIEQHKAKVENKLQNANFQNKTLQNDITSFGFGLDDTTISSIGLNLSLAQSEQFQSLSKPHTNNCLDIRINPTQKPDCLSNNDGYQLIQQQRFTGRQQTMLINATGEDLRFIKTPRGENNQNNQNNQNVDKNSSKRGQNQENINLIPKNNNYFLADANTPTRAYLLTNICRREGISNLYATLYPRPYSISARNNNYDGNVDCENDTQTTSDEKMHDNSLTKKNNHSNFKTHRSIPTFLTNPPTHSSLRNPLSKLSHIIPFASRGVNLNGQNTNNNKNTVSRNKHGDKNNKNGQNGKNVSFSYNHSFISPQTLKYELLCHNDLLHTFAIAYMYAIRYDFIKSSHYLHSITFHRNNNINNNEQNDISFSLPNNPKDNTLQNTPPQTNLSPSFSILPYKSLTTHSLYLFIQSHLLSHVNETDLAIEIFEKKFSKFPWDISGLDLYSSQLHLSSNFTKLSLLTVHFNTNSPRSYETLIILANHYSLLGQHDKAITSLVLSTTTNNNNVNNNTNNENLDSSYPFLLLGYEYLDSNQVQKASLSFQRALMIDMCNYKALLAIGNIYANENLIQQAISYFLEALEKNQFSMHIYTTLAQTYSGVNMYQLGKEILFRALRVNYDVGIYLDLKCGNIFGELFKHFGDQNLVSLNANNNLPQIGFDNGKGLSNIDQAQGKLVALLQRTARGGYGNKSGQNRGYFQALFSSLFDQNRTQNDNFSQKRTLLIENEKTNFSKISQINAFTIVQVRTILSQVLFGLTPSNIDDIIHNNEFGAQNNHTTTTTLQNIFFIEKLSLKITQNHHISDRILLLLFLYITQHCEETLQELITAQTNINDYDMNQHNVNLNPQIYKTQKQQAIESLYTYNIYPLLSELYNAIAFIQLLVSLQSQEVTFYYILAKLHIVIFNFQSWFLHLTLQYEDYTFTPSLYELHWDGYDEFVGKGKQNGQRDWDNNDSCDFFESKFSNNNTNNPHASQPSSSSTTSSSLVKPLYYINHEQFALHYLLHSTLIQHDAQLQSQSTQEYTSIMNNHDVHNRGLRQQQLQLGNSNGIDLFTPSTIITVIPPDVDNQGVGNNENNTNGNNFNNFNHNNQFNSNHHFFDVLNNIGNFARNGQHSQHSQDNNTLLTERSSSNATMSVHGTGRTFLETQSEVLRLYHSNNETIGTNNIQNNLNNSQNHVINSILPNTQALYNNTLGLSQFNTINASNQTTTTTTTTTNTTTTSLSPFSITINDNNQNGICGAHSTANLICVNPQQTIKSHLMFNNTNNNNNRLYKLLEYINQHSITDLAQFGVLIE